MTYFADTPPAIFYPILVAVIALYLWGSAAAIGWWLDHAPRRRR